MDAVFVRVNGNEVKKPVVHRIGKLPTPSRRSKAVFYPARHLPTGRMVIGRALSNGSSGWCLSVTRILVKVREIHRATVQFGQDRLRWEADEGDSSDVMGKAKKNYYAVAKGLDGPKIYRTWPECQAVVNGFPNAKFKGFATEREAQDFIRDCTGGAPSGTPSGTTAVPRMTHGSGGAGKTRSLPGSKRSPAAAGGDQGVVAGEIAVFTDGACQGNYNVAKSKCPAGWGVVVVEGCSGSPPVGGAEVRRLYGPVCLDKASPAYIGAEVGSNNTGELSAMCEAFRWLSRHEPTSRPAV